MSPSASTSRNARAPPRAGGGVREGRGRRRKRLSAVKETRLKKCSRIAASGCLSEGGARNLNAATLRLERLERRRARRPRALPPRARANESTRCGACSASSPIASRTRSTRVRLPRGCPQKKTLRRSRRSDLASAPLPAHAPASPSLFPPRRRRPLARSRRHRRRVQRVLDHARREGARVVAPSARRRARGRFALRLLRVRDPAARRRGGRRAPRARRPRRRRRDALGRRRGATTGVVTVARRDAAGTAEEMGTATLPDLPATAAEGEEDPATTAPRGARRGRARGRAREPPRRPRRRRVRGRRALPRGVRPPRRGLRRPRASRTRIRRRGLPRGALRGALRHESLRAELPPRRRRGKGTLARAAPSLRRDQVSVVVAVPRRRARASARADRDVDRGVGRRRRRGVPRARARRRRRRARRAGGSRRRARARLRRARPGAGGARRGRRVSARGRRSVVAASLRASAGRGVVRRRAELGRVASGAVPAATRRARGRDDARVHAGGIPADAALVTTSGGGTAIFAGEGMRDQLLLHDPAAGGGRRARRARAGTGGWLLLTAPGGRRRARPRAERRRARVGVASVESPRAPAAPPGREPAEAAEERAPALGPPRRRRRRFARSFRRTSAGTPRAARPRRRRLGSARPGPWPGTRPARRSPRAAAPSSTRCRNTGPGRAAPGRRRRRSWRIRRGATTRSLAGSRTPRGCGASCPPASGSRFSSTASPSPRSCACGTCTTRRRSRRRRRRRRRLAEDEPAGVAAALLREIAATAGAALQGSDAAVRGRPAAEVCYSRATGAAAALLPALADATARRAGGGGVDASFAERAAAPTRYRAPRPAPSAPPRSSAGTTRCCTPPHAGAAAAAAVVRRAEREGRASRRRRRRRALRAKPRVRRRLRGGVHRGPPPRAHRPLSSTRAPRSWCRSSRGRGARGRARGVRSSARGDAPRASHAARDERGGRRRRAKRRGVRDERPAGVTADAVAAVAEAHFGYEQLAELCEAEAFEAAQRRDERAAATAARRMHHYMRSLRGAPADGEGTFARFAFERMMTTAGASYHGGVGPRVAEMLRHTPDEFYDELTSCLESRPELLWTHQLRAEDFAASAQTLKNLSGGAGGPRGAATVASRRRFLSLAKLASLADGVSSSSDEIIEMDAALDLLAIQSRIAARRGADCDRDPRRRPWASSRPASRARARARRGARTTSSTRSPRSLPRVTSSGGRIGRSWRRAGASPPRRRTGSSSRRFASAAATTPSFARSAKPPSRAPRGGATTTPSRCASGRPSRRC